MHYRSLTSHFPFAVKQQNFFKKSLYVKGLCPKVAFFSHKVLLFLSSVFYRFHRLMLLNQFIRDKLIDFLNLGTSPFPSPSSPLFAYVANPERSSHLLNELCRLAQNKKKLRTGFCCLAAGQIFGGNCVHSRDDLTKQKFSRCEKSSEKNVMLCNIGCFTAYIFQYILR